MGVGSSHVSNLSVPENIGVADICFKRESGTTGDVTVNYQFTTSAIETTDYSFGAGSVTVGNNPNSVTFTDGDGANKCIKIQPVNFPDAGTPDRSFKLQITGLQAQAATTLCLARKARHNWWSKTTHRVCLPLAMLASCTQGDTCKLPVLRSNTGALAPAAQLNVNVTGISGMSITYTTQVSWPVIDDTHPAGTGELRYVEFTIPANSASEPDQNLTVSNTCKPVKF